MRSAAPLFGDLDPARIAAAMAAPNRDRFLMACGIVLRQSEEMWLAAVHEHKRNSDALREAGIDPDCLMPVFDLLVDAVITRGSVEDRVRRLNILRNVFDLVMGEWRVGKMTVEDLVTETTEQRDRRKYTEWKEDFMAGRLEAKPRPVMPRAPNRRK